MEIFISTGSNIENRQKNLEKAEKSISLFPMTTVIKSSSIYETKPESLDDEGGWFLNQVLQLNTELNPETLLIKCLELEDKMGRVRLKNKTISRNIDIDILLYNNNIISSKKLILPHPRLHKRAFVLLPLAELAPNLLHPVKRLTIDGILKSIYPNKSELPRIIHKFDTKHITNE